MYFKLFIKTLLSKIHKHKKILPDVFIYTLIRSGSTLLLEALKTDKRYKCVSEPLSLIKSNKKILHRFFNPNFITDRYTTTQNDDLKVLFRYFEQLSAGNTPNSYYWTDLFSGKHPFSTMGSIFKTHKITCLVDDFSKYFPDSKGIYLLRHPIPSGISRTKLKLDNYIVQFLYSEKIQASISSKARQTAERVLQSGSAPEIFTVSWCLENYVFFNLLRNNVLPNNLYFVSYEEIVAKPRQILPKLCEAVGINYSSETEKVISRPSHGVVHSSAETIKQIQSGQNTLILEKWKNQIPHDIQKKCFGILKDFEIDYYKEESLLPTLASNVL